MINLRQLPWRLWDQGQAVANARAASVELSRARVEREEIDLYLARYSRLRRELDSA